VKPVGILPPVADLLLDPAPLFPGGMDRPRTETPCPTGTPRPARSTAGYADVNRSRRSRAVRRLGWHAALRPAAGAIRRRCS